MNKCKDCKFYWKDSSRCSATKTAVRVRPGDYCDWFLPHEHCSTCIHNNGILGDEECKICTLNPLNRNMYTYKGDES